MNFLASALFVPAAADDFLFVISVGPVVTTASYVLSLNISPLITKNKARDLDGVSGKTLLPAASTSVLAFDSTLSDAMTPRGCGDCSGLSEVE